MRAWRFSSAAVRGPPADERARASRDTPRGRGRSGSRRSRMPSREASSRASRRLPARGVGPRHRDAENAVRPESLGGQRRRDGRVDAAGEAEHGASGSRTWPRSRQAPARARDAVPERRRSRAPAMGPRPPGTSIVQKSSSNRRARADQAASRVEGGRRSVEDEAVVAADEIAVRRAGLPVPPGDPLHHAPAQAVLSQGPGRGGDVDVEVEPERRSSATGSVSIERPPPERLVVPDVLADR